jgi:hypothetical protein
VPGGYAGGVAVNIFRRTQRLRAPLMPPYWWRGEQDAPPRPQQHGPDGTGIEYAVMSGPVRPEFDPCGAGPLKSGGNA